MVAAVHGDNMRNISKLWLITAAFAMMIGTSAFAESRHREGTNNDHGRVFGGERSNDERSYQRRDEGQGSRSQQGARTDQGQSWRTTQQGRINRDQSFDRSQRQNEQQQGAIESYGDRGSRDQQYRNNDQQYRNNDQRYRNNDQQYRNNDQQYRNRDQQYRGRADSTRQYDNWRGRNDQRNRGYGNNGGSFGRYGGRSSMFREGRVDRVMHERDGYRVWLGGFGYPFWIPEARWSRFPLRVGLSIRLGGWWDPLGYYDVYDLGPMGSYYNTAGDIHGIVESVDYRRGAVVLRDDISNSFVTVVLRGNDPRLGDLRPGDYVDLSGQWTRGGIFEAFRLDDLRDGYDRYDRYDRYSDDRY